MERKLRKSYLLMFPLFLLVFFVVISIGTWISAVYIRPSMAPSQHTAQQMIDAGLGNTKDQERVTSLSQEIVHDGGGIMRVHSNGQVDQVAGLKSWDKDKMSKKELTEFLCKVQDPYSAYKYSVAYDEVNEAWVIVTFPVSMRFQIIFASNHSSKEYTQSFLFYLLLAVSLAVTLFFFAWYYAKHSAKMYAKPLKNVCESVRQIAKGNYKIKKEATGIEELECLQSDVKQLADLLEEEKKATKQLADSKRQMLLDISHDLRNPLATILGYSESLCQEEGLTPKERENYMEVIYRNSMRAHALMNDLFEYTRLEEPAFHVQLERVELCEFLREFAASYVPDMESEGFQYEFIIPEEEVYVLLDTKQMERALGNIVHNCLRYNQAGTLLILSLKVKDSTVDIEIRDNGIGIEKALRKTIFLPFTRADKARNSAMGGSGLGLSISKKIIEACHGEIQLISDVNQGCNFIINLPITSK